MKSYVKLFEQFVEDICESSGAKVWIENKESGNRYTVQKKNFDSGVHRELGPAEIEAEKIKTAYAALNPKTVSKHKERVASLKEATQNADKDTQERSKKVQELWTQALDAKTEEERVDAVNKMIENNLIETNAKGTKIYLKNIPQVRNKHFSDDGDAVTTQLNYLAKKHGLTVPMRADGADRELADRSGKHNEAGVVSYLFPDEKNTKAYKENQEELSKLGGDHTTADKINKEGAQAIKSALPPGSEIIGAEQVGGIGKSALAKMGIESKTDPTDILIRYKDKDGKEHALKVSAKVYADTRKITMKNSGVLEAGETYLGETGKDLDKKVPDLKEKYSWTKPGMSDSEKEKAKTAFRKEYMEEMTKKMSDLAKTEKGQDQLGKMWKEVHGCGKDVHTLVSNKTTGKVELHGPNHYCDVKKPLKVSYSGSKMVVEMEEGGNRRLDIEVKTEKDGTVKLLFNHVTK
jgi:hypothetical protein